MSKSPNIFIPALGGTALVLGAAYGIASRDYGATRIDALETRVEQVEARAAEASQTATAEAGRAAELEARIAEVQAAADARAASGVSLSAPAPQPDGTYGIGREALAQEIAAWDVDVLPDGRGLPEGAGDVFTGEEVFAERCAACHGDFAEGVDNWPVLAGGFDTLDDKDPVKTVGSYWPYLSTVWDYIHRSMPFGEAGTLSADETYAIVAYILYSNDLVDDDFELSHENFAQVQMYNADGFIIDDRAGQEYSEWQAEPCMEGCKDEVQVTMRSVFLVETPPEGGSNSVMNHARSEKLPSFTADGPSFIPAAAAQPEETADAAPQDDETAAADDDGAELVAAGESVFKKCKSCHQVGDGAKDRVGPQLNGIVGRAAGSADGFKYSSALSDAGITWDADSLAAFLADPKGYVKGTKMNFRGLKSEDDIAAVIAYLASFSQ